MGRWMDKLTDISNYNVASLLKFISTAIFLELNNFKHQIPKYQNLPKIVIGANFCIRNFVGLFKHVYFSNIK